MDIESMLKINKALESLDKIKKTRQKYYTSDKGKLATKAANLRYYTKHRAKILLKHREKLLLKHKNLAIKKDESKLDVIIE